MEVKHTITDLYEFIRLNLGLTITDFAKVMKIPYQYYSARYRNRTKHFKVIDIDRLIALQKISGLSQSQFFDLLKEFDNGSITVPKIRRYDIEEPVPVLIVKHDSIPLTRFNDKIA